MAIRLEDPRDLSLPKTLPGLPQNYNFELQKTISTIRRLNAKKVTLQFPDGLLTYAPLLIDFIELNTNAKCTILDDVVYGACCVDDRSLESDLLIHYGHSCLIPVTDMKVKVLYIFVDISVDLSHFSKILTENFSGSIALVGTIQFNKSIHKLKRLIDSLPDSKLNIVIPQVKPLSPGEVLGCTSPIIHQDNIVYVGDGRFHLESAMIRNPSRNFYKYCPMTRKMTHEFYNFNEMIEARTSEIKKAREAKKIGVILGNLGRQGNEKIMEKVAKKLENSGKTVYKIIADEINADILDSYNFIEAFVQISCPRLSIDWGVGFRKPLLTPFEVFYEFGKAYEMDYYSEIGKNPWQNYQ